MVTNDVNDVVPILCEGGVGVLPTDTLYGIVGSALDPDVVGRIYELKERYPNKPLIVLIAALEDVEQFGVVLSNELREACSAYWPGRYSIVLSTVDDQFSYIERGTGGIAFRVPESEALRSLLAETGPLVAPSANIEGRPPARSIEEARGYFGSDVDFYVDDGEIDNPPSTIITFIDGEVQVLRP